MNLNTSNIDRYFNKGQDHKDWYKNEADRIIKLLPEFHGLPIIRAFAVTSMTTSIEANVSLAIKALIQIRAGQEIRGFLPNQITYLNLIKSGFDVPGRKIMSFIRALEGDPSAVVVDIWMCRAFGIAKERKYDSRKTTLAPTKKEYDAVEAYCIMDAERKSVTPREYQAAVWVGIKTEQSTLSRDVNWSDLLKKKRGFFPFD